MKLFRLVILLAAVAIVVFPAGMALGQEGANATRVLPDTVERGGMFDVTVTFTADGDNFSSISLNDQAPDGWDVTTNKDWCQPKPTHVNPAGNKTDIAWYGPYPNGTPFTVLYQVTLPGCNLSGNYSFDGFEGLAFYSDNYYDEGLPHHERQNITGDSEVQVIPPAIRNTTSIDFYTLPGQNPENETLEIWSSTPCMLNWTANITDGETWLSMNRTSGNCTDKHSFINLSVDTSGMSLGDYPANITINATDALFFVDANNSPQIIPVTLHITEFGILKGQVSFSRAEGPGDSTWETPLVVRFFNTTTKLEMGWSPINATTDAYGNFTIEDVYPGTYDIGIKNWTCLSRVVTNVTINAGAPTEVDFGSLLEGDVNNDDVINILDASSFVGAWLTSVGDPDYDPNSDFNRDGNINILDASALASNFLQEGDLY